jgi:dCTP diphosphatase
LGTVPEPLIARQNAHTPRNLLSAAAGEFGELSELFMWRPEAARGLPSFSPAERAHVGEEIADTIMYLTRLAAVCGIDDLGETIRAKMIRNAEKYPVDKAADPQQTNEYRSPF